ncbi:MAG: MmgE/PrpD family protein [Rhodobacteraceae bacterium]|nr:MmgE/PrpD family protein [Paracoccaceae bacterium]
MAEHRSLTAKLTEYIRDKPVTDSDLKAAHLYLVDGVLNMIAGRNSEIGRKLLFWGEALRDPEGENGPKQLDPARSAFLNGALCHALQLDDLHQTSSTHPGCAVIPALLALGQDLPARKVLTALLHGYEAVTRIGMATGAGHNRTWHNIGTIGPFGAAMAAAELLNLSEDQTVDALGNAGTQAGGFMGFLEKGVDALHLHAGRAAEAGLVSATLASVGFTGPARVLEGPQGLFAATCPDGVPHAVLDQPEAPWQLYDTCMRRWPACGHTHPTIRALRTIREEIIKNEFDPRNFSRVDIETYQAAIDLCDRPAITNMCTAMFSLQYTAIAAMMFDEITIDCFESSARESLIGACQRVNLSPSLDISMRYPQTWRARVTVHHSSGQKFTAEADGARIQPITSILEHDLRAKAKRIFARLEMDEVDLISKVPGYTSLDEPFVFTLPE